MRIENYIDMKRYSLLCLLVAVLLLGNVACNNKKQESAEERDIAEIVDKAQKQKETKKAPSKPEENLSGELIVLSEADFVQMVTDIDNPKGFQYKGTTPCIVDFYADWCRPCAMINPLLMELAQEYKGKVIFYKVNVDRAMPVVAAMQVANIPTLMLFKPNSAPTRIEGLISKEDLKGAIETVLLNNPSK